MGRPLIALRSEPLEDRPLTNPDHRYSLLRPRGERCSNRRAAEQRDKLAPIRLPELHRGIAWRTGNDQALECRRTPSAPPILTASNGNGALGCNRVPGDAAQHDLAIAA